MPISSDVVGTSRGSFIATADARWTMSYAAGLGDRLDAYFDTTRPSGVIAHPLFPVCVEWIDATRGDNMVGGLTPEEARRGVHYAHDLTLHRAVRGGDVATVTPTIVGVERHRAGAVMTTRFDAVDADGDALWTTYSKSLLRDVDVDGPDRVDDAPDAVPLAPAAEQPDRRVALPVVAGAAHVYTESARIWNPIHTDAGFAQAAGLPAIILHGTATLALAVSQIVDVEAGGEPERVRRIVGRFGAMVFMPSTLAVAMTRRAATPSGDTVWFEVQTDDGSPAVRHGAVVLRG